jgi:hypothetical protein
MVSPPKDMKGYAVSSSLSDAWGTSEKIATSGLYAVLSRLVTDE